MHRVHDNDVHDVGMLSRGVPCMDMHGEGVPGMGVYNHGFRFFMHYFQGKSNLE